LPDAEAFNVTIYPEKIVQKMTVKTEEMKKVEMTRVSSILKTN
jgi:hypothetical protein